MHNIALLTIPISAINFTIFFNSLHITIEKSSLDLAQLLLKYKFHALYTLM